MDNGQEMETTIRMGYIGIMEKNMETITLVRFVTASSDLQD